MISITNEIVIIILVGVIIALSVVLGLYTHKTQLVLQQQQLNWANSATYIAGFKYDYKKNIFTSRQDALQRLGGYNNLYDDLSTLLYMVIDIEPIVFVYNGIEYMIELWKGQYCAASGCEIGFYIASQGRPGRFYCAPDNMMLDMSYTLQKVDTKEVIFNQSGVHWWLTGFKAGFFNQPENLSLENINIKFPETGMAQAFFKALSAYFNNPQEYQYKISGNTVSFRWQFTKFFPQPNSKLRPVYQIYNYNIVSNLNNIMGTDYTPEAINNKILEFLTFLNTNDNVDSVIDWFLNDKPVDNVMDVVNAYDTVRKNKNINNLMALLAYIKGWYGPQLNSIEFYGRLLCSLYPFPICEFIIPKKKL